MSVARVRSAYRASDREQVDPDIFMTASYMYAMGNPDAAQETARIYCALGADRCDYRPVGDEAYVTTLFNVGLRQHPESQVCRLTTGAVGISLYPTRSLEWPP